MGIKCLGRIKVEGNRREVMGFWERWSGLMGAMLALALLLGFWQLLGEGEDLEARDSRGRTPLIVAAEEGETDRVAELV